MPSTPFVHLAVRSTYSLAEGTIAPKKLSSLCRDQGMPAIAITDRDNLFGALEFSVGAAEAGIQPIIGCQLTVARQQQEKHRLEFPMVTLLAASPAGYRNLIGMVSRSYTRSDNPDLGRPFTLFEELLENNEGLILLTGGPDGLIGSLLQSPDRDPEHVFREAEAINTLQAMSEAFGERIYMELRRHDWRTESLPEHGAYADYPGRMIRADTRMIELAYKMNIPLVATNDIHFPDASFKEAHDVLLCSADGTYINTPDRRRLTADHRFLTSEEMTERFQDVPEAISNTLEIARRCHFLLETSRPMLPAFQTQEGRTEDEELRAQAEAGLEKRLAEHVLPLCSTEEERVARTAEYRQRLEYEIGVINKMQFPGYFLIVSDFIKWAKKKSIPVGPGRGSGAGSMVAWSLEITDLDPIRWGLLFERFLNPDRVSMPDFDIDFCETRREEVIHYVRDRYGSDRVAQIVTFAKLKARAVLRSVGRVMQMPHGQVDRICKMVPDNPSDPVTLPEAIAADPRLAAERDKDEASREMIETAIKLEGLYSHASTHAAGVVIGNENLSTIVPLYRDPRSEMPATQFNMKWVEQAGLVKFDFLGLRTLTLMEEAIRLIREGTGREIDLSHIPLDDAGAYRMMAHGRTVGVFQLESVGMQSALMSIGPDRLEDIIAIVALYRPGPMENIPVYAEVKKGLKEAEYPAPVHLTKPILEETCGIMVYQEQVMEVARKVAGYSLGAADLLRRAMGKKIKEEMDAQRKIFVDGAVSNGVSAADAESLFDTIARFASYGFNKSHAAAYGLIAYQTAWLKQNFPAEFLAASMSLSGSTEKVILFKEEAGRMGIPCLPPDINYSGARFTVVRDGAERPNIRYGLASIKGLGAEMVQAIIAERKSGGPFSGPHDFMQRMAERNAKSVNRRQLQILIEAGAFDNMDIEGISSSNYREDAYRKRTTLLYEGNMKILLDTLKTVKKEKESKQISIFETIIEAPAPSLVVLPGYNQDMMLKGEFDRLGHYLSGHPAEKYTSLVDEINGRHGENGARSIKTASEVIGRFLTSGEAAGTGADSANWEEYSIEAHQQKLKEGASVRFSSIVVIHEIKNRISKAGNPWAIVNYSDPSGCHEAVLFGSSLGDLEPHLKPGGVLVTEMNAEVRNGSVTIRMEKGKPVQAVLHEYGLSVSPQTPAPGPVRVPDSAPGALSGTTPQGERPDEKAAAPSSEGKQAAAQSVAAIR